MIIAHGKLVANDTLEGLQKLFVSHRTLTLSVKGDAEIVKNIASSMEGVLSIEAETDLESGYAKVVVSLDEKADIREGLSLVLAEQKMPVMSMALEEKTLEDIFIELTGTDDDLAVKKTKKGDR